MSHKGEGSVKIQEFQWERFFLVAQSSYDDKLSKKKTKTVEEKRFRDEFLEDDSSNQLWIQIFRDCLSESLGFEEKGAVLAANNLSVADRMSLLDRSFSAAIERFNSVQSEIASKPKRNIEEEVLLTVKLPRDVDSLLPTKMTLAMVIDIGRLLGFYRMPRTQSWIFAGRSFQMAQFCQTLYNDLNHCNETVFNPDDNNHEVDYPASDSDRETSSDDDEAPPPIEAAAPGAGADQDPPDGVSEANYENDVDHVEDTLREAAGEEALESTTGKFRPGTTVSTYMRMCVLNDCFAEWAKCKLAQKNWENYYCVTVAAAKTKAPKTDRVRTVEGNSATAASRRSKKRALATLGDENPIQTPLPTTLDMGPASGSTESSSSFVDLFPPNDLNNTRVEIQEAKAAQDKLFAETAKQTEALLILAGKIGEFMNFVKDLHTKPNESV